MRVSVRNLLLTAAIAFFVLVLVFEENSFELLAIGLACIAAGLLADDLAPGAARHDTPGDARD